MHTLWQHPNGIWYVRHGLRLRARTSTRTRDRAQAEVFYARFIASRRSAAPSTPALRGLIQAYYGDRVKRVRSPKVLRRCCEVLISHLGNLQPHHLTPPVIRQYAGDRKVSAGTVLREIGALRAALAWAVENRMISAAPTISNPVPTPPPRDRWITKAEAVRLLDACKSYLPHVYTFILLGLMTAARAGAILEAKWDAVDFDHATIDFGRGHGNKRRALVPINDELFKHLQSIRPTALTPFIVEYRGKPLKTMRRGFTQACQHAGLSDVTPHILRHSSATWMAMDGVPLSEIARFLGDSEAMVEKVYAKHTPGYLRRAASAVQLYA